MNYIAEIKAFHDLVQIKQLSSGQIALWYGLMYINNKCTWVEWFTAPNLTLELNTGLSRSGIAKARNVLKQHGIIDFKQNGTKATAYKLASLANSKQENIQNNPTMSNSTQDSNQVGNQIGVQDSNQSRTQDGAQSCTPLNKLNETKQKDKESKDVKASKRASNNYQEIINGFTNDEKLKEAIWSFIQMRINSKKKPTDKALDLTLKRLKELSSEVSEQIAILNKSTMSNWTSVYPLKQDDFSGNGNKFNKSINSAAKESRYDYDKIQERIREKMWSG
ncbi:hypothetical protein [Alkalibacter mobilis]|uniref:hypothetical protein n=1 Tax=Alkalibacter mobilis TaxID=2787712 RepID=UPI00189F7308|nr:hypothetical protein [Alkalibacter mobilis]MBF7097598.1 hypothetical protein [Alkalibacter mobilis]